ncbi:unnamed protein product [Penicillium salamii]|uniref:Uncharacterized protein n=1 Tax=Penicillium salamii TaxID=1612424 RepID=A0A9W4NCB3_9EURO|nr:unnamed protein product [Penicillium salamii]
MLILHCAVQSATNAILKIQEPCLHSDPASPDQRTEKTSEHVIVYPPFKSAQIEDVEASAKEKEASVIEGENTTTKANAPRIGFKHDPAEEAIMAHVELEEAAHGKKKKKRRPKSQRGIGAPTGFEPWHADAPMTPAEFEENKRIYDPALPILETCYYMPHYNPETQEEIKMCTDTMKNFFTYLLYHDVCPEQKEDLEAARESCDRCEKELWLCHQIVRHDGPGHFNRACSTLFAGYYYDAPDDPDAWHHVRFASEDTFTRDIARKVIKYAIAINGDDRMTRKFKCLVEWDALKTKQVEDIDGFEIISIEYPSKEARAYYRELAPDLLPVGRVKAKEFRDESRGEFDLAPWEKIDWDAGFAPAYKFEFFVEESVLDLLLPGMKVITTIYETNWGMHFYDEVMSVLPTNYLFTYNDLMLDYKPPEPIEWIGDQREIERRRAEAMVVRPPERSQRYWVLFMLAKEMSWVPPRNYSNRDHCKNIINCLEIYGFNMDEIKEKLQLTDRHIPVRTICIKLPPRGPNEKPPVKKKPAVVWGPGEQGPGPLLPLREKFTGKGSVKGEPAEKELVEEEPVKGEPVEKEPVEKEPVEKEPVEKEPVEKEPVEKEPVEKEPVEKEPVEKEPVEKEPVEKEPVGKQTMKGAS